MFCSRVSKIRSARSVQPCKPSDIFRRRRGGVVIGGVFLDLAKKRLRGTPIFSVSREQGARRVRRACQLLGIECPVLHQLRHTGPANDILHETRSFKRQRTCKRQVRRRGRWAALKSAERYSKTAHLVADLANLPMSVRSLGEAFLASPSAFVAPLAPTVRFAPA